MKTGTPHTQLPDLFRTSKTVTVLKVCLSVCLETKHTRAGAVHLKGGNSKVKVPTDVNIDDITSGVKANVWLLKTANWIF